MPFIVLFAFVRICLFAFRNQLFIKFPSLHAATRQQTTVARQMIYCIRVPDQLGCVQNHVVASLASIRNLSLRRLRGISIFSLFGLVSAGTGLSAAQMGHPICTNGKTFPQRRRRHRLWKKSPREARTICFWFCPGLAVRPHLK